MNVSILRRLFIIGNTNRSNANAFGDGAFTRYLEVNLYALLSGTITTSNADGVRKKCMMRRVSGL